MHVFDSHQWHSSFSEEKRTFIRSGLDALFPLEPNLTLQLEEQVARALELAALGAKHPSLLHDERFGRLHRGPQSLVEMLCHADSEMGALKLPMRALMGEAFLAAKAQLFRAFRIALRSWNEFVPPELLDISSREVAHSVYTILLAELLWDLVRSRDLSDVARHRAATELVRLWEAPDRLEIADFYPLLEAVWQARNRITVTYGALVGVVEFFRLVREDCPAPFVSYFMREDVVPEENDAFQEFLFGISREDLEKLRAEMARQSMPVVDARFVAETLNLEPWPNALEHDPEVIYGSFRRRQRAASSRRFSGAKGPHHTAEGYMLRHVIQSGE